MRPPPKPTGALGSVDTRPLRQQIADSLMRAILDGDIRPGEALVEMDIASRLGVSRAPVREALQLLAHTSLVETAPYRGTTVRRLTRTDVEEVYSLRTIHETFALRRAMAIDAAVRRLEEHIASAADLVVEAAEAPAPAPEA